MVKKMISLHLDSIGIIQPIFINEFLLVLQKIIVQILRNKEVVEIGLSETLSCSVGSYRVFLNLASNIITCDADLETHY